MTTSEKIARLMQLRDASNDALYERLLLCKEIMQDRDWIDAQFRSDADALEHLRDAYFPQIAGLVSPGQLLELIEHFPARSDWESRKFDLRILLDDLRASKPTGDRDPMQAGGPTKAELRERVHDLELQVAKLRAEKAELEVRLAERRAA